MKLLEFGKENANLVSRRQDSRSKVVGSRELMKSAARHNANTGRLQQLKAVEHVRLHAVALDIINLKKKIIKIQLNYFPY
jgi:hypothetical protein